MRDITLPQVSTCHVNDGMFILQDHYYRKILYKDILWLKAAGSYCYLYFRNNKKIIVVHPLAEVEQLLPQTHFKRIHRSTLVNVYAVEAFTGNSLYIDKVRLDISASFKNTIGECFDVLERKYKSRRIKG